MKSVYKIFAVILAAGLTIMSCDKKPINEDIPVVNPEGGDETDPADGPRVITVSFNTKATRTILDEDTLIPSFQKKDVIVVTDGQGTKEECEVYFVGEYARIDITKETLKDKDVIAVYPKSAYIDDKPYFKVPSVQDGTFANANICKTKIAAGATAAVFENQTAIFEIKLPDTDDNWAQVKTLNVKSLGRIDTTGQRGSIRARITDDINCPYDIRLLDKYNADGERVYYGNPIYVSVLCDTVANCGAVQLVDLNFDIHYYRNYDPNGDSWHTVWAQGGFSPYFLKSKSISLGATVSKNSFYSGVEDHLHEYFNAGNVKWAKESLGPEGENTSVVGYFMWGETTGHAAATTGANAFTKGFSWSNAPFNGGKSSYNADSLASYSNKVCSQLVNPDNQDESSADHIQTTLTLAYDAAYQNWGGAWRMPRKYDDDPFTGFNKIRSYVLCYSDQSDNIISFEDGAKYGNGTTLSSLSYAVFWTSTLCKANNSYAHVTYVQNNGSLTSSGGMTKDNTNYKIERYIGHPIRPVSGREVPLTPNY